MPSAAKLIPRFQIALVAVVLFVFFYIARRAAGLPFIEEKLPYWAIHICSAALVWSMMWRVRAAYMSKSFASLAVVRWFLIAFGMSVMPLCLGEVMNTQARWIGYGKSWPATELRGTVTDVDHFRKFRSEFVRMKISDLNSKEPEAKFEWKLDDNSLTKPELSWVGKSVCLTVNRTIIGMHVRSLKLC